MNPFKYESNARENQDLFVLALLNKKKFGTYVEIGSYLPQEWSNTYLLEKEFFWRDIGIEWNPNWAHLHKNQRTNPCFCLDATSIDYDKLFQENNLGPHIDYLQLDIDPPSNTLKALNRIDFNKYQFSIITYEHDFYNGGHEERDQSRNLLESHGYQRVISDVCHDSLSFEDWWVKPELMLSNVWKLFQDENCDMNNETIKEKHKWLFESLL